MGFAKNIYDFFRGSIIRKILTKHKMKFKRNIIAKTVSVLLLAAAFSGSASAQDVSGMSTTELRDEATSLANARRYLEARPYIAELIKRIEPSEDKSLRALLQQFYFFEAYGYLQEYDAGGYSDQKLVAKAIDGFDKVIKNYPDGEFAVDAIKTKANCYEAVQDFENAVETRAMLLKLPYAMKLTNKERYEVLKRICQVLYNNRKWKIGQPWFKKILEQGTTREDKVFGASALIQSAIAEKNFDEAKKYIPYMVYNTIARNDPALNIAFITAGDELSRREKFGDASVFFNMFFSRDVMAKNLEAFKAAEQKKLNAVKALNAASPLITEYSNQIKTLDSMIKMAKSVPDIASDMMARAANNYLRTERNYESFWAYWQLTKTFPDHKSIEDFYFATIVCALRVNKLDTMYQLSEEYLEKFEEGQYVKDVELGIIQYYLGKKDYEAFFANAMKFIDENGDTTRQSKDVIFLMGKTWLDLEKPDMMIKTFTQYIKKYPDSSISESCMYWAGMGYMAKSEFEPAMKMFRGMIDSFPIGIYVEDGTYRCGVSAFGAGHYTAARDTLEEFLQKFPSSALRGEVEFFLGDIYANVNAVDLAMAHYMAVEKCTKNKTFITNAYMQGAKLLHNVDKYEEEAKLMDTYISKYPKGNLTEASYNKGKALEMLGQPADALMEFEKAIERGGGNCKDDAVDRMILEYDKMYKDNYAKLQATVEFIKKLLSDKKLLAEMISVPAQRYRYFQAHPKIDRRLYESFKRDRAYGAALLKNTKVLEDLLAKYEGQIAKYPKGTEDVFKGIYERAKAAKNVTLEYRIMMGLDNIGKPVSHSKMFTEDDFKKASVRTLVWIGKENEKYSADAARKAYAEARARDEYEYEIDALFAHADLEVRQKRWGDVLKLYTAIENEFPADPRAAEAVISKGDAYSNLGQKDKAFKEYETVLRSPAWRGEAHAQALFKLGELSRSNNKVDKALMYYDRCYLGFANCYKWTGKAVLEAAKLLSMNGKSAEAKSICTEFINNVANKASPEYNEIKLLNETL